MDDTLLKQARPLNLRNGGQTCAIPPIVLMTDDLRLPDPHTAIKQLPRDSMVVFRHYIHPDRYQFAQSLRQLCKARHIPFLVANDLALALQISADGIHLPEYRILQTPGIYRQLPRKMLVTSACHSLTTLRHLGLLHPLDRPDGVMISPLFATQSHPGASSLPLARMRQMASQCHQLGIVPIGLGGINHKTCRFLRSSTLASLAGIGFSSEQSAPLR
ncbi:MULTISPECIES: thiamine phosphate synthase [Thalassospira]|uniref:Thiamine phosphate synthase n=1 Tax=Thalassospira aquimaris TaxID=3037796 RepID=A0ABT6G9K6_9PROT|nr:MULTISPECIES: thiamine phosphate synthase [Thalassospira]MDG4718577.1 thiamine phosphate synthase [Thalassospira sp. FZY0004]